MRSTALFLGWLAVLAMASGWLILNLRPAGDLTAFLPAQTDGRSALLLDELRQGSATRLILMSVDGADSAELAVASKQLVAAMRGHAALRRIDNGQRGEDATLFDLVHAHRYLLTPKDLSAQLTPQGLGTALQARLRDLGSALEIALKDLLASDPTHETLAVLEHWRPANEARRNHGVWFDAGGQRALLIAETRAPGFDLQGQAQAVDALTSAFAALDTDNMRLTLTGPGPFGLLLRDTTRQEAQLFSTLAVAVLLLFLWLVYRSFPLLILGGLPLASGVLAALLAVQWAFGGIHGITLAFGVTLLGVAIDYPLHLFSHRDDSQSAAATMHGIWPTLRLGVLSTCIAYLTLLFSDFPGLAQLGLFTVTGLLTAAGCTRWLLPPLLDKPVADISAGPLLRRLARLRQMHLPPAGLWIMLLTALGILAAGHAQLWENDLGRLTPVPREMQAVDTELRLALGAAELRHLLVIEAPDQEQLLQACESAARRLDSLVEAGLLKGYDQPARYLPSHRQQAARQAALPEASQLRAHVVQATQGLPFRPALFDPFIADVSQARSAPPLTADSFAETPIATRLAALLKPTQSGWRALLPLQGVTDVPALSRQLAGLPLARLVDLKRESAAMVAEFRGETLRRIALASLAIVLVTGLVLSPRRRLFAVLLPVFTTVLCEAALFRLLGVPLSLFHLVSLMLVGGIVLDYALFFNRPDRLPAEQVRTLHALSVCAVSTLTVFGILALSEIPVLRAIGVTVAAGVLLGYILAALSATGDARDKPDDNASTQTQ